MGIAEQLRKHNHKTTVIGVGPKASHDSFADKLSTPWTPYTRAIEKYVEQGNKILRLSESEIRKTYLDYRNLCNCEPSSSIVFAAPDYLNLKNGTVVFVNSGNSTKI